MPEEMGESKDVKRIMRYISEERQNMIGSFCGECKDREYQAFVDPEMALMSIPQPPLMGEDADVFVNYSGYNFRHINNAARGRWNYEENGTLDKAQYEEIASRMKSVIDKNQYSIGNTKLFRGVTLDYFRDYGIHSLEDMDSLCGQMLLDKGFVSTSLVEDRCFYKMDNELGLNYNVKIEYLVPEEFTDGICLSSLTYSPGQCEYLINAWNMAKVVDVIHDGDGVIVKACLVPKKVYDEYYSYGTGSVK